MGSAQPALIRGVSESLAGRVGLLELDPLTPAETGLPTATHWLAGGFPDALRGDFRTWWEPYATNPHDARKLEATLDDIGAEAGWLVGIGGESTSLTARVHSVSLDLHPEWLP